jgi:hypothetical protein
MNGGLRTVATLVPKEWKKKLYLCYGMYTEPKFYAKKISKKYGIWPMVTKYLLHEYKKEKRKK